MLKGEHITMNDITYTRVGDYLLPDIILSEPPPGIEPPLGLFALKHQAFLREHRPALYAELLLTERLYPILRQIDHTAKARLARADENQRMIVLQWIEHDLIYR